MVAIILAATSLAAGPLDEIDAAREAMASIPIQERPTTLFVSMLGTEKEDRERLELAFNYALNSTTFRRRPVFLTPVVGKSETLYRVDVAEIGWPDQAYKKLISREPYFYPLAYDVYIVRADWIVREATFGETYYDLLGFGKTRQDVEKRVGLDRKTAENLNAKHGARAVESGVTLNPRFLARYGSTLGAYWETSDFLENNAKGNPFENFDQLDKFADADAHEAFGPLPNGLFWWALYDKQGNLQNAAPTTIAADRRAYVEAGAIRDVSKERPSYRVVEVQNAHSCMGCHAAGLRPAPDFVAGSRAAGKLKVLAADKKKLNLIDDFFDQRAQSSAMTADSIAFTQAVERITGKPALESGNVFAAVRWKYAEAPVSIEQAARELSVSVADFEAAAKAPDDLRLALAYWFLGKSDARSAQFVLGLDDAEYQAFAAGQPVPLGGDTLKALVGGTAVPRARWEDSAYLEASLLICYQQKPRDKITAEQVRERMKPPETKAPPTAKIDYGNQTTAKPQRRRAVDQATGRPIEFDESSQQWRFVDQPAQ